MYVNKSDTGGLEIEPSNEAERELLAVVGRVAESDLSEYQITTSNHEVTISFYIPEKDRGVQAARDDEEEL